MFFTHFLMNFLLELVNSIIVYDYNQYRFITVIYLDTPQWIKMWTPKSSFHIEDFESLLWANEGGPIWEMIVSSPISNKNFDDSKSSMWKEL